MSLDFDQRESVFNALFDAHYAAVRAYAWRRDTACADDIVAETFLVAWRRLEDVPCDAALPWLLAVARNTHLNSRRGEHRRRRREASVAGLTDASEVPHDASDGGDGGRALRLLNRLSESDQEVLRLVAWEGLDRPAIARVLGCSRANVAVRLHRARRRFRTLWVGTDAAHATEVAPIAVECRRHLVEGGLQND